MVQKTMHCSPRTIQPARRHQRQGLYMVIIELVTKHYEILGTLTPIELRFYDNGYGRCLVATHPSNKKVSLRPHADMDREITMHFERMLKRHTRLVIEMPDSELLLATPL